MRLITRSILAVFSVMLLLCGTIYADDGVEYFDQPTYVNNQPVGGQNGWEGDTPNITTTTAANYTGGVDSLGIDIQVGSDVQFLSKALYDPIDHVGDTFSFDVKLNSGVPIGSQAVWLELLNTDDGAKAGINYYGSDNNTFQVLTLEYNDTFDMNVYNWTFWDHPLEADHWYQITFSFISDTQYTTLIHGLDTSYDQNATVTIGGGGAFSEMDTLSIHTGGMNRGAPYYFDAISNMKESGSTPEPATMLGVLGALMAMGIRKMRNGTACF